MRIHIILGTQHSRPVVVRQNHQRRHQVALYNRGKHPTPAGAAHIPAPRETGPAEDRYHLAGHVETFRRVRPDVVVHMIAFTRDDAEAFVRVFSGLARRAVIVSSSDVYLPMGLLNRTESGPPVLGPMNEDAPQRRQPSLHGPVHEKQHVEQIVSAEPKLPATILRFPAVYGPGTYRHGDWIRRMLDDRPAILIGKGYAGFRWSHGYAEDVALSITLAATDDRAAGRIYNVGERDVPTERQRLERVAHVAGWTGRIVEVADEQLPGGDGHPFPAQDWWLDTSRIRAELGYREVADEDDAIRATIAWQRDHPDPTVNPSPIDYATEDAFLAKLGGFSSRG
jgi:nucleoside-diphosphate-sugar epimerase